jgi:hypothetical protein
VRAVLAVVVVIAAGAAGAYFWLQHTAERFSLTLELKTPQGERGIRVTGTEIVLEERERKREGVLHNCEMGPVDFLAFRKLARETLNDKDLDKKSRVGTFMLSVGDDDPQNGNGDVDAAQAAALTEFIVKRLQGCVDLSRKL